MLQRPPPIARGTKDWTAVITEGCGESGYSPHDVSSTGARLWATVPIWQNRLARQLVLRWFR